VSAELFQKNSGKAPLADRMRPRTLEEFIGQDHIVGPGRLLRRAIQLDRLSSIILSGPPGTGKTTLARVIAGSTSSRFLSINAVLAGVQAIRDAAESAERDHKLYDRKTILFVDEVHRWNRAQQDALLPYVENGTIILIGATTENPFFEVNKALVSRSRVFQLRQLSEDELLKAAKATLADKERGYGQWNIGFEEGALTHLVKTADGDARSLLNALELAVETSDGWPLPPGSSITVSIGAAEESIQKRAILYDKDGDSHYDTISAFIKSIRGSDPDAALYWLARMIYAGEEPRFIFRRLLIAASEDVGLACPEAISIVASCAAAYDRIGLPEGQYQLAEATLFLAAAPKSNSAIGYFDALAAVEAEMAEVPDHLKDANRDAKGFGHGAGYLYPHAYRDHWAAQQYLPDSYRGAVFYQAGSQGYEKSIRSAVMHRRDAQLAAWLENKDCQPLSAEPDKEPEKRGRAWAERAGSGAAHGLMGLRDEFFRALFPLRHVNALVLADDSGLFIREAVQYCHEGSVTAIVKSAEAMDRLAYAFNDLEELQRPAIAMAESYNNIREAARDAATHSSFDCIIAPGFLSACKNDAAAIAELAAIIKTAGPELSLGLAEKEAVPGILPGLVKAILASGTMELFYKADADFFASGASPGYSPKKLEAVLTSLELEPGYTGSYRYKLKRSLGAGDIDAWLAPSSAYGKHIRSCLKPAAIEEILDALKAALKNAWIDWPVTWTICTAKKKQGL